MRRDRLIVAQWAAASGAAIVAGLVPARWAILPAMVGFLAVVALGMGRHGLWRLP